MRRLEGWLLVLNRKEKKKMSLVTLTKSGVEALGSLVHRASVLYWREHQRDVVLVQHVHKYAPIRGLKGRE